MKDEVAEVSALVEEKGEEQSEAAKQLLEQIRAELVELINEESSKANTRL